MPPQGDVFDPSSIVAILKNFDWPQIPKGKANFEQVWRENVSIPKVNSEVTNRR